MGPATENAKPQPPDQAPRSPQRTCQLEAGADAALFTVSGSSFLPVVPIFMAMPICGMTNNNCRKPSVAGSAIEAGDVEFDALRTLERRGVLASGGLAGLHVGLQLSSVLQAGAVGVDHLPVP